MRDVAFGQYYPTTSFVHNIDARSKILLNVLFMVGIFFITSFTGFAFISVLLFASIALSRVPIKSVLRSIKGIIMILVFTSLINLFIITDGTLVFEWWIIRIYDGGIRSALLLIIRLTYLMMGSSLLTLTTTPVDLTHAIESLLKPVKRIFPVHEFALIMSLTLSLIPSLITETDRIINAQKARGASFDSGSLIARAKAFVPILIPLLVSSFRRAEELAFAMNSRCYEGATNRTQMRVLRYTWRDAVAALVYVVFFSAIFVVFAMQSQWITVVPLLYF